MTTETNAAPPRHHPFEGIRNFRDLGGYPTEDGGMTRYGVIFRAATLVRLTPADRERMKLMGIGPVFDLRSHRERTRDGLPDLSDTGVAHEHTPVFPDSDVSPEQLALRYRIFSRDVSDAYMNMLTSGAATFRRIVEAVAVETRPVLFHCAGGKDRTGVLAALFLALAGVPAEQIVADYALTTTYLPRIAPERRQYYRETFGLSDAEVDAMTAAPPQAMERLLARLAAQYSSAEAYLLGTGVAVDTLQRVRERFVAPAAASSNIG